MILRDYQSRSVADLFAWWTTHQGNADIPLLVLPTGSGKSVICAEIVRQMWEQWPEYRPRTVVLVPRGVVFLVALACRSGGALTP